MTPSIFSGNPNGSVVPIYTPGGVADGQYETWQDGETKFFFSAEPETVRLLSHWDVVRKNLKL